MSLTWKAFFFLSNVDVRRFNIIGECISTAEWTKRTSSSFWTVSLEHCLCQQWKLLTKCALVYCKVHACFEIPETFNCEQNERVEKTLWHLSSYLLSIFRNSSCLLSRKNPLSEYDGCQTYALSSRFDALQIKHNIDRASAFASHATLSHGNEIDACVVHTVGRKWKEKFTFNLFGTAPFKRR